MNLPNGISQGGVKTGKRGGRGMEWLDSRNLIREAERRRAGGGRGRGNKRKGNMITDCTLL